MTQYERELAHLIGEQKIIPRQLRGIKRRGRNVKSFQRQLRKADVDVEIARRACLSLPKPWQLYKAHGVNHNLYARKEVQDIRDALEKAERARDMLNVCLKAYNNRYSDRQELRARLKSLPGEIICLQDLIEIKNKNKKPIKQKTDEDWKKKWREVAPGLVIPENKLRTYLKTFSGNVELNEETVTVRDNVFIFKPFFHKDIFLKLNCRTWQEAEYARRT